MGQDGFRAGAELGHAATNRAVKELVFGGADGGDFVDRARMQLAPLVNQLLLRARRAATCAPTSA